MRVPAPIVALAWRLATENKRLRRELDAAKAETSVAKCREKRWKKAAYVACEGNHAALRLLAFQAMSDDWADAPEVTTRNTSPRSLP